MSSLGIECALSQKKTQVVQISLFVQRPQSQETIKIWNVWERQDTIKCWKKSIYFVFILFAGKPWLPNKPIRLVIRLCFLCLPSTFGGGAVKPMQTQPLTVQMSGQRLEEGWGACDGNITGAPHQHMGTWEVKEGHLKAWVWEHSSSPPTSASTACVYETSPPANKTCFNCFNADFTD